VAADLTITRDEHIVQVCLNRPAKKNALTLDMYDALAKLIESAELDRSVRVIVVMGKGGNFTSGNDLGDFPEPSDDSINPVMRFITAVIKSSVPMIAAVDGLAVGIGATMLSYFDAVIADEEAKFLYPFINLALPPEAGSTLLLPKLLGYSKAAQLLMRGKPFSGKEAFEMGLVTLLSPAGETEQSALQLAREFSQKPPAMMRITKRLLRGDVEAILDRISQEERELKKALSTTECKEAIQALMGKRPPLFS
jgi:enoyl-CoA hydratase/carnithine racemase